MRTLDHTEKKTWHQLHADEVLRLLEVDLRTGLTPAEAARRREVFGANRITPRRSLPRWRRFVRQFHQPLVYILIGACGITAFLGEWLDAGVIFAVMAINAIAGYAQELKAADAIAALTKLVRSTVTVRRDGVAQRTQAEDLVPGDVVLLEPGDRVGADLRLFAARELRIDESTLTGESLPAHKHADPVALESALADRKNLAFAGTLAIGGHGEGVVWATGDRTETGKIARLIAGAENLATPLTRKIERLSRGLLAVILAVAAVTFAIGLARGQPAFDVFMSAVALAVGAIPEGLPAAVTIALAIGVSRMARRGAVIRNLPIVETLGSATVICSDKTGTLTENQMTVREVYAGGQFFQVSGSGYAPHGEFRHEGAVVYARDWPALEECLRAGVLCNDARLTRQKTHAAIHGDPTELALLVAGEKAGLTSADVHQRMPRLDMIPFESARMFRATLHEAQVGRTVYQVGAAERILERCDSVLRADGESIPLDRQAAHLAVVTMGVRGLRVLACARKELHGETQALHHDHVAAGLTLLGLMGMYDPPRPGAVDAVRQCREAGIEVKMITGDHLATARAIAAEVGLQDGSGRDLVAVSGRELEKLSDEALVNVAEDATVFARVAPEHKLRLVRALQARGHVVAMTGDGVNDAPALRQADIGVAMGRSGTDVAKQAADMVLVDDNFATVAAAVEEGRGVYENLIKFIVWNFSTNAGEAAILLTAIALGSVLPALPLQLLWINLAETAVLGLTLMFEPKEPDLMRQAPRDPRRPLIGFALLMRTGLVTLLMLAGAFWLFDWEQAAGGNGLAQARTAVVNLIVIVELVYLFNCRSLHRPSLGRGFLGNPWAFAGAAVMLVAQLAFTYVPVMNRLFHTAPISMESWARIVGVAVTVFVVVELEKWIRFGGGRGTKKSHE